MQNLVGKVVQVSPNLTPLKALLWNDKLVQDKFKVCEKQDSSTQQYLQVLIIFWIRSLEEVNHFISQRVNAIPWQNAIITKGVQVTGQPEENSIRFLILER